MLSEQEKKPRVKLVSCQAYKTVKTFQPTSTDYMNEKFQPTSTDYMKAVSACSSSGIFEVTVSLHPCSLQQLYGVERVFYRGPGRRTKEIRQELLDLGDVLLP